MSAVRTDPLTPDEIASFHERGFLFPIRVLDDAQVEEACTALDDHLEGRRQSQQYELTDPIIDSGQATAGSGAATSVVEKKPHSVPFLFNLWERDERFWKIDSNPVIAGMARQLLGSDEAREIPRWLSQRRRRDRPSQPEAQARLAGELEALRLCHAWLERLERGERIVVNLRPETDPETEYVAFDRPRVLRVLARIIADLDELAGYPPIGAASRTEG